MLAPSGRAHHSHLSSLARDGFAHLCTDSGVGLAPGQASSSPLSAEPSIRFRPDKHPGHASGSALFRKGTFGAHNRKRGRSLYAVQCTARGLQNRDPKMSVTPVAGLGVASSGRAHHPRLPSLVTYGLAHLCTESGVRSPPARGLSIPLSGAASIRWRQYPHSGHSSESALFRKCTFGAIRRLTPSTLRVAHAAKAGDGPAGAP